MPSVTKVQLTALIWKQLCLKTLPGGHGTQSPSCGRCGALAGFGLDKGHMGTPRPSP